MDITSIITIDSAGRQPYVPPLSEYTVLSDQWLEQEFHCLDIRASRVVVGFWTGEPGRIRLDPWPYTEVCSIHSGRVAVVDLAGNTREFGARQSFIVPVGFRGEWVTIESSSKSYVAIYPESERSLRANKLATRSR
jgi:uncharacterized cupin superfamily protein